MLNLAVNTGLHEGIQAGAFLGHLIDVTEFGAEGDGVLVAAVLGHFEAEALFRGMMMLMFLCHAMIITV